MKTPLGHIMSIEAILSQVSRSKRVVVTAGMPYANGPLHLGHLAGAQLPADIFARFMGMLIGRDNVLFVCGTDDHGSTSEVAALQAGVPTREFIGSMHQKHRETIDRYGISLDVYTGTSRPECFPEHRDLSQDFIRCMYKNGLLEKRITRQWFDPKMGRFLQDRFVRGKCPNVKCTNEDAYSDNCDVCGQEYDPSELINPRSAISDATPIMKETAHLWLDMWKVSEVLRIWIQGKEKTWRRPVYTEVINTVLPTTAFQNIHEAKYKELKSTLPKHKPRYAPGKKVALQFENKEEMAQGQKILEENGIECVLVDGWAHRSLTRDVTWGIPVPEEIDPELSGKTLYVWPDSLIAPISFTRVALKQKQLDPERYKEFWCDPNARVYQFLGQDNVFFYVLMQGAMWLGTQEDPQRLPIAGEYQLTDIFGCFHLLTGGDKMSKSRGNSITPDELVNEKGYSVDQIRYYLALLSLPENSCNFDFAVLDERNRFLAGPMNSAFERPISAVHSKFGGRVPEGVLLEKAVEETEKIVRRYLRSMERAEYATLLGAIENYARIINSLFNQYKPHDDRHPEEPRRNALYTCFYVLKNLTIMLYPFVPETMEKLRESLRLPPDVFRIEELGKPIPPGHEIGPKQQYFPSVPEKTGG
ncbi:MAG: class I tRNA ligase family protein [Candidatus Riflebacteria bacterium]|nr:class I tRNA ligase family protein [Candidatus Riflebacteria bacterium]